MKTSSQYTQNNFIVYLMILLTFFILLFFTKNIFSYLQVALDTQGVQEQELAQKEAQLSQLNTLKTELYKEGSEEMKKIQGFTGIFSDAQILEYIYSYAQKVNLGSERIIIRDLSLNEEGMSDLGFNKASITVSAVFSSETTLFAFMDYLTNTTGEYKFYIQDFTYPLNQASGNIQASLPFTFYYK